MYFHSTFLGTLVTLATSEVIKVLDTRGDYARYEEPFDFFRTNNSTVPELNKAILETGPNFPDLPTQFSISVSEEGK